MSPHQFALVQLRLVFHDKIKGAEACMDAQTMAASIVAQACLRDQRAAMSRVLGEARCRVGDGVLLRVGALALQFDETSQQAKSMV